MRIAEWLEGGIPDLERERDDSFAKYHQTMGALQAIRAVLRWLDEQGAAADNPADRPSNITELRDEM